MVETVAWAILPRTSKTLNVKNAFEKSFQEKSEEERWERGGAGYGCTHCLLICVDGIKILC
jgi:hypothetical protein